MHTQDLKFLDVVTALVLENYQSSCRFEHFDSCPISVVEHRHEYDPICRGPQQKEPEAGGGDPVGAVELVNYRSFPQLSMVTGPIFT